MHKWEQKKGDFKLTFEYQISQEQSFGSEKYHYTLPEILGYNWTSKNFGLGQENI